jgi:hypothetical protein
LQQDKLINSYIQNERRKFKAHYRCPERFAKFNATTSLNTEPVFELENARIALTRNADGNGRASLDVGELAKHLQQELYLEGDPKRYGPSGLVRDIYYTVRPLLPPKLRRILQRLSCANGTFSNLAG